jgi:hypothetical protein
MPANYPDWRPDTPKTDSNAKGTEIRKVSGFPAIRVHGATYRGSQPIDGVFELVSSVPQLINGEERYEVYCSWFGVKPRTMFPRISVSAGAYELISNYSGDVIDNIST